MESGLRLRVHVSPTPLGLVHERWGQVLEYAKNLKA